MEKNYPSHIYDPTRIKIATSYLQHEMRKLLCTLPQKHWSEVDKNISNLITNPELSNPRDFWNGFHGICMGYKLKIGLLYYLTAENITWKKEKIKVNKLSFGTELKQTKVVKSGKLPSQQVIDFYSQNKEVKKEQQQFTAQLTSKTQPRDHFPIIVTEKIIEEKNVLSTYDGNRRLIKAILEDKKEISAFVSKFALQEKTPKNYWIPTSLLMEILYFAEEVFDRGERETFLSHVNVLKNMMKKSKITGYEIKERALTKRQPFRDTVLKNLGLQQRF